MQDTRGLHILSSGKLSVFKGCRENHSYAYIRKQHSAVEEGRQNQAGAADLPHTVSASDFSTTRPAD